MELPEAIMKHSIYNFESAAAVAELAWGVGGTGELPRIQEVVAYHDDPAGATLSWRITSSAGGIIIIPIGATAVSARVRLGDSYTLPLWLPYQWNIAVVATGALAAGKKFYMAIHYLELLGVPAGTFDWL